jgi:hypothetical protein
MECLRVEFYFFSRAKREAAALLRAEVFVADRSEGGTVSVVKSERIREVTLLRMESFVGGRSEGDTVSTVVTVVLGSGGLTTNCVPPLVR